MARIRTIKPEFWQDEKMTPLSDVDRLLFLFLVSNADDCGRLLDKPVKIEADMFDGEHDRRQDVCDGLATLSRIGRIRRGKTASGQRIIEIVNWSKHQKVDHPNIKSAFPEIVAAYEDTDSREPLANVSRMPREPLAHHTNDQYQRPVPTTSDLFANDASASSPPVRERRRRPRPPAQYPHFPTALCQELYVQWVSTYGAVEFAHFRKALGPLFLLPEAERAPEAPTDAELAAAMKSYVDLAPMGNAARFASVNHAAGCLASIARTRRECADDPARRSDAVMRIIHGAPMRVAS